MSGPTSLDAAVRKAELLRMNAEWDRAMVSNDADAIGQFMTDDWTIAGPDGRVTGREAFLGVIRSGALMHDTMESHDVAIRMYGDAAVLTGRGISGGTWEGQRFHLVERVTSLFVRQGGTWRCAATHLSMLTDASR